MVAGANSCNGSGYIIVAGANSSTSLTAPILQRLKALDLQTTPLFYNLWFNVCFKLLQVDFQCFPGHDRFVYLGPV